MGVLAEYVVAYVAPEWIVVGTAGGALCALAGLFLVLVNVTRTAPAKHRVVAPERVPVEPEVTARARHRVTEPRVARDGVPRRPVRREHI